MNGIAELFKLEGNEICKLADSLDMNNFQSLINRINNCKKNIFITGCGTSAMAAKKAVHTLNVIGKPVFYLNPSDAVHGGLGAIQSNDLVIFISKGGSTKEVVSFIPNLKEKNTEIIAITEKTDSIIARSADLVLKVHVDKELDEYNMLATTSTMAVISVFDVLTSVLMKLEDFSESQFLTNHPSGAVGMRLKEDTN